MQVAFGVLRVLVGVVRSGLEAHKALHNSLLVTAVTQALVRNQCSAASANFDRLTIGSLRWVFGDRLQTRLGAEQTESTGPDNRETTMSGRLLAPLSPCRRPPM